MTSVRITFVGGALTFRALFEWQTPIVFVSTMVLTPLFQILFFTSFGPAFSRADAAFFATGNAIQVAAMAGVHGASQTIANERLFGAVNNVFVTPANRVALYVGRAIPHMLIGALTSAFGLTCAVLLTSARFPTMTWLPLSVLLVVTSASCASLGMLFGAVGLTGRDAMLVSNVAYLGLLATSGAVLPMSLLPDWLATAVRFLPLSNGVAGLRELLSSGVTPSFWALVGAELLVGAVWTALTLPLLRRIENRARATGALDFV